MSPKSKVQGPKSGAEDARCVVRVEPTQHATRNRHHSLAFTLIEIMIVVAIMGIVMTMSVPIVYKVWHKAPMRKAVSDIVEVCSHARARAILQGTMTQVTFHPKENRLELSGVAGPARTGGEDSGAAAFVAPAATGSGLSAKLDPQIIIETLDINMSGMEFNDAESATVRFYPNGISDEMRMILFDGRERMGIELEITTGLASVVNDPLREWTRR